MAAAAVLVCGMITHLYMLTNKLYNYFEMGNIFSDMPITKSDTLAMGRVFLPFVTAISTPYSSPMINGILAFLMIAAAAYMVVDLLAIRKGLYAVLCGVVMITFPGIASYLSYGINTDVFCGAIVLAVLSIYLTEKLRFGWLGGIVCLGVSIGTYQPFMSVAIAVVFLLLFRQVLELEMSWKQLVVKSLRYAAVLAAGFVFYYVCLQIALKITGITMGDYHGINEMTSFTLKGIVKGIVYAYGYFLAYFFTVTYTNSYFAVICNLAAAAALTALLVCRFRAGKKEYRTAVRVSQVVVLFALLPVGLNAAPVLMADRVGNGVDRYMMFSVILTYVLLMKAADDADGAESSSGNAVRPLALWGAVLSVALTAASCFYICNMAYHRLDAATQSIGNYLNRIAADLEKTDEWKAGMPVYFANCRDPFGAYYEVDLAIFERPAKVEGTELKSWYNYEALVNYLEEYMHFPITVASPEQIERILADGKLREMPVYPQEGSMQTVDGVLVIKMNQVDP